MAAAFCAALAFTAQTARADTGNANEPMLQEAKKLAEQPPVAEPPGKTPPVDHSGRKQKGKASFYAQKFNGRKMANGRRFNPNEAVAASKSLPLGTVAKVTNVNTGQSTVVKVEDRGPYVNGRVVDLAPKAARQIGIDKEAGVAPVVVAPVAVPQPGGQVKAGAGAAEVPAATASQAIEDARQATPKAQQQAAR